MFNHLLILIYKRKIINQLFHLLYNSKNNQDHDPGFIVIDEVVGMMISLFFIPKLFKSSQFTRFKSRLKD